MILIVDNLVLTHIIVFTKFPQDVLVRSEFLAKKPTLKMIHFGFLSIPVLSFFTSIKFWSLTPGKSSICTSFSQTSFSHSQACVFVSWSRKIWWFYLLLHHSSVSVVEDKMGKDGTRGMQQRELFIWYSWRTGALISHDEENWVQVVKSICFCRFLFICFNICCVYTFTQI